MPSPSIAQSGGTSFAFPRGVPRAQILISATTPEELALLAHLRYVSDQEPGFTRSRNGHGFVYQDPTGRPLTSESKITRVESLAIPPAWRDVWICRFAKGHLQATGRDSRKRKQYLYHPRWSEISNVAKFARLGQFGSLLPALRAQLARQLAGRNLSRERVLAGVVALLDATTIRIGNEEYVAQNGSYGLTTLRDRHVIVSRDEVALRFVGKGGFRKEATIVDPALVRFLKQARRVPGARLFQFERASGKNACRKRHAVTAADVNQFLAESLGESFTAKDFRTWKASALVAGRLYEYRDLDRLAKRRRMLKTVVDEAAAALGNTPTICRNYYIHPGLLASYQDGSFSDHFRRFAPRRRQRFSREEQVLERFLQNWEAPRTAEAPANAGMSP
jgi:DNA topoisomerase-1